MRVTEPGHCLHPRTSPSHPSSQFNTPLLPSSATFPTAVLHTQLINKHHTDIRRVFFRCWDNQSNCPGAFPRCARVQRGSRQLPNPFSGKVQTLKYLELLFEGIYFKAALTAAGNYQGGTLLCYFPAADPVCMKGAPGSRPAGTLGDMCRASTAWSCTQNSPLSQLAAKAQRGAVVYGRSEKN